MFGVHAIAGIVGAVLTGPFAAHSLGGFGNVAHPLDQLWIQARGVGFTVAQSTGLTWVILKLIDVTPGLRVDDEQEQIGLDLALHDERLQPVLSKRISPLRQRLAKLARSSLSLLP